MVARQRSEAGFTLLEMLVAVTVLGFVMVALGSASFVAYRTMDSTSNALGGSTDAQLLSIYLPPDLKSADTGSTASVTCTGATASAQKLVLTSNPYALGGVTATVVIVYWVNTITVATTPVTYQYQLVRSVCTTGTKASDIVVVRNLYQASSATATAITGGYQMAITEKKASRDSSYYTYSVSGRFRTGIST